MSVISKYVLHANILSAVVFANTQKKKATLKAESAENFTV